MNVTELDKKYKDRINTEIKNTLINTELNKGNKRTGKVRDQYALDDKIILITTDRQSAFDRVLASIPFKGQVLNLASAWWFEKTKHIINNHVIDVPDPNVTIAKKCNVIPIEFVVRGYITGSGWKEYTKQGTVCGITLPEGLKHCEQLPEPIFTPATKAVEGHDENIDFDTACTIAGRDVMNRLRDVSVEIYRRGAAYARERGIILADTKFEFGYAIDASGNPTDEIMLIDEVLTPDSSRFWPAEDYEIGRDQDSFDKQFVRNYLEGLVGAGEWDKTPPGPALPDEIVMATLERYREAHRRLFA